MTARRAAGVVLLVLLLGGCAGPQSALDPGGPSAARLENLWWGLFAVGSLVVLIVAGGVARAVLRRRGDGVTPRSGGERTVVVAGIAIPTLVLLGAFGVGVSVMQAEQAPPSDPVMTITVVGHQWWWEVRYPDFTTANEIHIPVGGAVRVRLLTADVVHSFWVPSLTKKTDLLPNKENETWLLADRAGTYRGQCAEFCGKQHAGMGFLVIAEPTADFESWLDDQAAPSTEPLTEAQARGQRVLEQAACSSCHTVRGTTADGDVGPDLTHLASRRTIGAALVPNDRGWLGGWVVNPQTIKPGNQMPPQPVDAEDLQYLLDYLESLD